MNRSSSFFTFFKHIKEADLKLIFTFSNLKETPRICMFAFPLSFDLVTESALIAEAELHLKMEQEQVNKSAETLSASDGVICPVCRG